MATLTLEEIAEKAKAHVVTAEEKRDQRISMIMGLRDSASTLTREEVQDLLDGIEGHSPSETTTR